MFGSKKAWPVAAILMTAWLAACDGTTEPEAERFDAEAALEDYEALDGVLGSSAFDVFRALGERTPFSALRTAPVTTSALRAAVELARTGDGSALAVELTGLASELDAMAPASLISERNRGATFVYDPQLDDYVREPSRTGAPSNGIRFILYEEVAGKPDPSREIGYADLIDESEERGADIALRFLCVQYGVEVLDYRTTLDRVDTETGAITVEGFLQGDTDRLDFDLAVQGTGGDEGIIEVEFVMGIETRDFEIVGSLTGSAGEQAPGAVDVRVRHGEDSLRVDLSSTGTELAGTFYVQGQVFATASGDPADPTFTSADGDPLSTIELGVLIQMVGVVEEVFHLFGGLMAPVAGLVWLGILL